MSGKTKIYVLHMKELVYTVIIAIVVIILLIILLKAFSGDREESPESTPPESTNIEAASDSIYSPGTYTTSLVLGNQSIDVEIIIDQTGISSINMLNLSDDIKTMYPLLEPTFNSICQQICETQSTENITYASDNKYTALVLLETIQSTLSKATNPPEFEEIE